MTADVAIGTTGLTKDYGRGHGLFGLDLEVRRGEVCPAPSRPRSRSHPLQVGHYARCGELLLRAGAMCDDDRVLLLAAMSGFRGCCDVRSGGRYGKKEVSRWLHSGSP
jgi:hypothetical protein